ncbi:Uncharacterized protein Fot_34151 [Forsythia ovata]|uniref:Uncharacterized protein n=1 Tax=Forsythia ovata TaxID=205694 RepID=A0ABD1SKP5_9LAMI
MFRNHLRTFTENVRDHSYTFTENCIAIIVTLHTHKVVGISIIGGDREIREKVRVEVYCETKKARSCLPIASPMGGALILMRRTHSLPRDRYKNIWVEMIVWWP